MEEILILQKHRHCLLPFELCRRACTKQSQSLLPPGPCGPSLPASLFLKRQVVLNAKAKLAASRQ